jgi:hypothetical protein
MNIYACVEVTTESRLTYEVRVREKPGSQRTLVKLLPKIASWECLDCSGVGRPSNCRHVQAVKKHRRAMGFGSRVAA